ncbi:MAG: hypothetical protein K2J74_07065 [Muribaculaceae bacterium]|nr:hypothetical protein [Muribaculaceae bacterium]
MTEQEMNSYRFTSGKEPSDEMLAQIMREACIDAKQRQEQATKKYFNEMRKNAELKKAKWANRINQALNGE